MSRLINRLLNKTQNNKPSQQTTSTAPNQESETTRHSQQEPDYNNVFSETSPRISQQQPNKYRRRALLPVEVQRPRTSGVGENEMIGNFLKRGGGGGDGGGKWKEST